MELKYIWEISIIIAIILLLFFVPILMHRKHFKAKKIEECAFFSFLFTALILNTLNVVYDSFSIYPYHQGFVWASIVLGFAKMFILERINKGKSIKWINSYLSPLLISLIISVFILTTKSDNTFTVSFILGMAASYPIGNILYQLILLLRKKKLIEIYGEEKFEVFRYIA